VIVKFDIILYGVVGSVKVIGERRELSSDGIDLSDEGDDAVFLTETTDGKFGGAEVGCELTVGETGLLCVAKEVGGDSC